MICCSNTCEKCNHCGKYIYNLSAKYRKEMQTVESLATYGWGSISTDKCEVHYECGPNGNYALHEPVVIEEELSDKDLSDIFLENISKKDGFEIPD